MFESLGHVMYRRRRWVLALSGVFVIVAVVWGTGVFGSLANGGFDDPNSESAKALEQVEDAVGRDNADVVLLYESADRTVDDPAYRAAVEGALADLPRDDIAKVTTFWSVQQQQRAEAAARLVSEDRRSTYAVLTLRGSSDDKLLATYRELEPALREPVPGLELKIGGDLALFDEVNTQVEQDIKRAETISLPLVLILLVIVFGGLVAASLPLAVGGLAILGAFTVLRLIATVTDVSIFSINIVTMIGLGLAIDYALFVVTRFREQLARGDGVEQAIVTTMATAGRTIAFSGATVAVSIASLAVFPVMFLQSMAYGGTAAIAVAMVAALTVLPALLAVLGHRIDSLRIPLLGRRRTADALVGTEHGWWYRLGRSVMRRPVAYAAVLVPLLLLLGLPFTRAEFGGVDHRALPAGAESRVVAETLQRDFPGAGGTSIVVAAKLDRPVTGSTPDPATGRALESYLERLRAVEGVDSAEITGIADDLAVVSLRVPYGAQELAARDVVEAVRAVPASPGLQVTVGGMTASVVDLLDGLGDRLPWMGLFIVLVTFLLLFLAFGSVVLPLKAVVMNVLSLSASFGALVWVFQDGHLANLLGFTSAGYLEATQPILLFAVVFGLSMDYELFLLSRVREEWDRTGDNTRAVAIGLQRTGRIITSAALLLGVVVVAFSTSGIVFIKMIGLGMVLALLIDATIVRALLVPATMRLLGRLNWWAPAPLARFWQRYGIREGEESSRAGGPRERVLVG
jgi:uncharacterized membrane protein YdfJ with MMPL/SSD domain